MRAAAAAEAGRADRTAADAFVWKISATSGLISFDFAATNHRWGGETRTGWNLSWKYLQLFQVHLG